MSIDPRIAAYDLKFEAEVARTIEGIMDWKYRNVLDERDHVVGTSGMDVPDAQLDWRGNAERCARRVIAMVRQHRDERAAFIAGLNHHNHQPPRYSS